LDIIKTAAAAAAAAELSVNRRICPLTKLHINHPGKTRKKKRSSRTHTRETAGEGKITNSSVLCLRVCQGQGLDAGCTHVSNIEKQRKREKRTMKEEENTRL
jgi:hypothetical protein